MKVSPERFGINSKLLYLIGEQSFLFTSTCQLGKKGYTIISEGVRNISLMCMFVMHNCHSSIKWANDYFKIPTNQQVYLKASIAQGCNITVRHKILETKK